MWAVIITNHMSPRFRHFVYSAMLIALMALRAGAAAAQLAQRPDPDPSDPKAKAPDLEYRSAFDGYRRFGEEDLADWRKSNEEVGAAGGHAGHQAGQGRGASNSRPQPGSPETLDRQVPPGGQGGHHQ